MDGDWARAKKLCRLSVDDIRKAKALGMSPKSLIKNIPSKSQQWKAPVKVWIRDLFEKRFGGKGRRAVGGSRRGVGPVSSPDEDLAGEDLPAHTDPPEDGHQDFEDDSLEASPEPFLRQHRDFSLDPRALAADKAVTLLERKPGPEVKEEGPGECVPEDDEELRALYEMDQDDRKCWESLTDEDAQEVFVRDADRRNRVEELVRSGVSSTANDYFHAAMVLQHGETPDDFLLAHILATIAGFKGHPTGRWLAAATLDRYLHRTGKAQVFGTQSRRGNDGAWTGEPFSDLVTDRIRREVGVSVRGGGNEMSVEGIPRDESLSRPEEEEPDR